MNTTSNFITKIQSAMDNLYDLSIRAEHPHNLRYNLVYQTLIELSYNLGKINSGDSLVTDYYYDTIIAVDYYTRLTIDDQSATWASHLTKVREYIIELEVHIEDQYVVDAELLD